MAGMKRKASAATLRLRGGAVAESDEFERAFGEWARKIDADRQSEPRRRGRPPDRRRQEYVYELVRSAWTQGHPLSTLPGARDGSRQSAFEVAAAALRRRRIVMTPEAVRRAFYLSRGRLDRKREIVARVRPLVE